MLEVIYISPSCKQAVNFIYDLVEKIKQNGISNFEVDMKRLQIKSDKFIISVVDIWGSMLGRGYSKVEYYIDDIRIEEYKDERTAERIVENLKYLKSSFRQGVKEISEEELIEILTEASA